MAPCPRRIHRAGQARVCRDFRPSWPCGPHWGVFFFSGSKPPSQAEPRLPTSGWECSTRGTRGIKRLAVDMDLSGTFVAGRSTGKEKIELVLQKQSAVVAEWRVGQGQLGRPAKDTHTPTHRSQSAATDPIKTAHTHPTSQ